MNVFQSLKNDRVTLVKKDGQRFENLSASVQTGLILTDNPEIPIEDGDQFERQLPSGIVDVYTVVDSGFQQSFHSIPAHYQSKVRKNTARPRRSTDQRREVVYNLIGSNARVDTQRPWDRRTPESDPAYEAFAAYLDTGSLRDA